MRWVAGAGVFALIVLVSVPVVRADGPGTPPLGTPPAGAAGGSGQRAHTEASAPGDNDVPSGQRRLRVAEIEPPSRPGAGRPAKTNAPVVTTEFRGLPYVDFVATGLGSLADVSEPRLHRFIDDALQILTVEPHRVEPLRAADVRRAVSALLAADELSRRGETQIQMKYAALQLYWVIHEAGRNAETASGVGTRVRSSLSSGAATETREGAEALLATLPQFLATATHAFDGLREDILAGVPNHVGTLALAARHALRVGHVDQAFSWAGQAVARRPADPDIAALHARARIAAGAELHSVLDAIAGLSARFPERRAEWGELELRAKARIESTQLDEKDEVTTPSDSAAGDLQLRRFRTRWRLGDELGAELVLRGLVDSGPPSDETQRELYSFAAATRAPWAIERVPVEAPGHATPLTQAAWIAAVVARELPTVAALADAPRARATADWLELMAPAIEAYRGVDSETAGLMPSVVRGLVESAAAAGGSEEALRRLDVLSAELLARKEPTPVSVRLGILLRWLSGDVAAALELAVDAAANAAPEHRGALSRFAAAFHLAEGVRESKLAWLEQARALASKSEGADAAALAAMASWCEALVREPSAEGERTELVVATQAILEGPEALSPAVTQALWSALAAEWMRTPGRSDDAEDAVAAMRRAELGSAPADYAMALVRLSGGDAELAQSFIMRGLSRANSDAMRQLLHKLGLQGAHAGRDMLSAVGHARALSRLWEGDSKLRDRSSGVPWESMVAGGAALLDLGYRSDPGEGGRAGLWIDADIEAHVSFLPPVRGLGPEQVERFLEAAGAAVDEPSGE